MGDRVGQQLGNYRLVKLLGKGGFAEVYLGQHVRLASKQAAIKILHLLDVDARRFQEEAETTEQLVHHHIVRLLDFDLEQGTPFLVLDYAPGGSLRTRHPKGSVIPLVTVGAYLKELAPALQYAHDKHILHRDIKPDNMLIGRGGELLLSDFGIAVLTQTGRTSFSSAYHIGGTPFYMAPETYRGRPVKESDQYALAVVVYEWLCGSVPFSEGDFIQLGYQHAHEPVPPLREQNPAIPPDVELVVTTALAKDPRQRFGSVLSFATAFEQASQVRQPEPELESVPIVPVLETKDANQSLQATAMTTPVPGIPLSQQTVSEDPVVLPAQPQTLMPLSGQERLPLAEEERRQAEGERDGQANEQTGKIEKEPVHKAKDSASDAKVAVKPAKIGISQRFVLLGLAGLVIVALASGIAWFTVHHAYPTASITEFPVPTANSRPAGITAGPDGNLWFTESGSTNIGRISPSGTITEFPVPGITAGPNSYLEGITAGPDGNLWFTDASSGKIGRISPSGRITVFPVPTALFQDGTPAEITAGPDGNLWFTDSNGTNIGRISPSGTITAFPVPTANSTPAGITSGPDGNLWFTEEVGNKIGRISPSGTITEFPVPTAKSGPTEITSGPDGNLWFTEVYGNKIGRITFGK